jgi:5-methyltetrahydrofolate--homocysteine methyltransferase
MVLDGATGMNLFRSGLQPGEPSCVLNLRNPQAVYELHKAYIEAGSDAILTNTLNANPLNFKNSDLSRTIRQAVAVARRAAGQKPILADIGPLGALLKPYGDMDFDDCRHHFTAVFHIFKALGVRDFILETFNSLTEAKAAFFAGRSFADNIFVSFSLEAGGATLLGEIPETIALTFSALGASGIGINCTEPDVALRAIERMARVTELPLIVKPNAGKVSIRKGRVVNSLTQADLAAYFPEFVRAGANMIGGCCGTNPEYIRRIRAFHGRPAKRQPLGKFFLASPRRILDVDRQPAIVVGERLNPSGRRVLRDGIRLGDYMVYGQDAKIQEEKGADALDVNAFIPEIPETLTLEKAIYEVVKNTSQPLFIDTQSFEAANKIMAFYPGVGVYNSIPARPPHLKKWLPLVRSYGFKAVISLVGNRVPQTHKERMANVRTALSYAKKYGVSRDDLIFDPLVFPIASEPKQFRHTLRTLEVLNRMGLRTILGVSNVSFGLDNRSWLNAGLAAMAMQAGVRFLIVNPLDEIVMNLIKSGVRLRSGGQAGEFAGIPVTGSQLLKKDLIQAIIEGDAKSSVAQAEDLLKNGVTGRDIIDNHIGRALKAVGDYYQNGKFFLPDLMRSAETSKQVLELVKKHMPAEKSGLKGRVVIATVKGDIHDIGKNIVAMIFESAGFEVFDLGKDVAADKICGAVRKYRPDVLGLSALLTTTMPEMGEVIKRLRRDKLSVKVIIGGPNVSPEYARQIGADAACHNALEGLEFLEKNIKK